MTNPSGAASRGRDGAGPLGRSAKASALKPRLASGPNGDRGLVEALVTSKVFQDYERAFTEATGMPVALRPVESWQLPHHGHRNEGPFCAMISEKSRACGACLQVQERLTGIAANEAGTVKCPNGLCETAVPVRLGDRLVGFLQTGQVFRQKPTVTRFDRVAKVLAKWGVNFDLAQLRKAYFSTRVVAARQHDAIVKLLTIFAQHLSMLSNQVLLQTANAEPPIIAKAKEYIQEHQTDNLRLGHVAKHVNTSTFYFCKIFKKEHRHQFHRLPLPRPHREIQEPPPQPEPPRERNRLRSRLPIADPFQPRLQEDPRPVPHGVPRPPARRQRRPRPLTGRQPSPLMAGLPRLSWAYTSTTIAALKPGTYSVG